MSINKNNIRSLNLKTYLYTIIFLTIVSKGNELYFIIKQVGIVFQTNVYF